MQPGQRRPEHGRGQRQLGLGIAVVGGELTPDDYLVSKVTGEVVRQTVSDKGVEYGPDAGGSGTVRRDVPAERRSEPCLGEAELAALVDVARRIEAHYGSHQDVEWAIARASELPESIVVLQSRPVTTLPQRAPAGAASAIALVMSKFGAGEETVILSANAAERSRRPRDPAPDRRVGRRGAAGRDGGVLPVRASREAAAVAATSPAAGLPRTASSRSPRR